MTLTAAEYAALGGGSACVENVSAAAAAALAADAKLTRAWERAAVYCSDDGDDRGGVLLTSALVREWAGLDRRPDQRRT